MLRDNEGLVPGVKCPAREEELGQVNKEDPLLIEDLRWVTEDRGEDLSAAEEELGQVNKEDPLLIEDLRWVTEDRGEDLSAAIDDKWVRMVTKHLWVKARQGLARCNQTKVCGKSNPVPDAARNFVRK